MLACTLMCVVYAPAYCSKHLIDVYLWFSFSPAVTAALPTLDISEGALNVMLDLYKATLPSLGGYITYAGQLDRNRLEVILKKLGERELQTLQERAEVGDGEGRISQGVAGHASCSSMGGCDAAVGGVRAADAAGAS